jgi:hypothetical protein
VKGLYKRVLDEHLGRLDRLKVLDSRKLHGLYELAQQEQFRKLHATLKRLGAQSFTAQAQRGVLGQLRQGQVAIARGLAGSLGQASRAAQAEGVVAAAKDVRRLQESFVGPFAPLPIEEASVVSDLVEGRAASLLRIHEASMSRYGATLIKRMEQQLSLSVLTEETPMEATDRIERVTDLSWPGAERIVRTEQSYAFNLGHRDAMVEASSELDGLYMRWTEHVDDDGDPLDSRVGTDSIAMHGQLAEPGGVFTMPTDDDVSKSLQGRRWEHPPNRPNDRAVLAPWRYGWGIPGWFYRDGRRVQAKKVAQPRGVVTGQDAGSLSRWTRMREYDVPLSALDDVPAKAWNSGRSKSIHRAIDEGKWGDLPPIKVVSGEEGLRELEDGNHRLAVARERGQATIKVRFLDRASAEDKARPRAARSWIEE